MSDRCVRYRIDASGRITAVNDAWERFARENGAAAALAPAGVIGRSLWGFIADATTVELYRRLVDRARSGQPARFTFRCDSPELRRTLQMRIRADGEEILFETSELRVERHARGEPVFSRGGQTAPLRVCGWCGRVEAEGRWVDVEDALDRLHLFHGAVPLVTHGICDACFHRVSAELPGPATRAG